ncbi:2-isopropylmalate synthase [Parvibium lacunae]|uniref:2-isopropylmalate synthase n=1 Tax=Parvibium lacunae TaxID=1888893 RepID=A0A368L0T2_9BURK|nr:2-isopropylmalate synthase [Parvibium lacunae]RCS57007.1 2-isopropylmalate synthase [Parvibium lacunae]
MLKNPSTKYQAFPAFNLPNRQWPSRTLTQAPIWCSSDLRDGNQSLIEPMNAQQKMRFFKMLVAMGFKEIEVAFPSASQTDFDFVRELITGQHIPDDVTIQVLTQAREDLIARTFESLRGAKRAIVHVYNATAPHFRRIVFNHTPEQTMALAVQAATWLKDYAAQQPATHWRFEYSPEVFSQTEFRFARDICNAVLDVWQPTPNAKPIINLPATIEGSTPNVYADQIEWMSSQLKYRNNVVLSVHPHNDRGTAVAAAELAQMAGADRVEGCLFGNGERTGNVDIITLALNLYTQGIDPQLDIGHIDEIARVVTECNQLPIHPRHPYVGELVHTAFSGSHQDAIKKGMAVQNPNGIWEVPYLPIDPQDIGRSYDAVIRVNSQSGKGGMSYLLEREYGVTLPRRWQMALAKQVQAVSDETGKEVSAQAIWQVFQARYVEPQGPWQYAHHTDQRLAEGMHEVCLVFTNGQQAVGQGNGVLDAAVQAVAALSGQTIQITHYQECSLRRGSDAPALALIEIQGHQGKTVAGAGIDTDIVIASIRALLQASHQLLNEQPPLPA